LYALQQIVDALAAGKHVWSNVRLQAWWPWYIAQRGWRKWAWAPEQILLNAHRVKEQFHVMTNEMDLPRTRAAESSRLVVIDEAQLVYNCRDGRGRGAEWLQWFSQSRKFGTDVFLVAQDYQMIDRQLRMLCEQVITSWALERWSMCLVAFTLPIGRVLKSVFGPVFYRRCKFAGMGNSVLLWRSVDLVHHRVAQLYDTAQVFGADAGASDEKWEVKPVPCSCGFCSIELS
jgi:hypothetical protein